jgi:hypothetical protein
MTLPSDFHDVQLLHKIRRGHNPILLAFSINITNLIVLARFHIPPIFHRTVVEVEHDPGVILKRICCSTDEIYSK